MVKLSTVIRSLLPLMVHGDSLHTVSFCVICASCICALKLGFSCMSRSNVMSMSMSALLMGEKRFCHLMFAYAVSLAMLLYMSIVVSLKGGAGYSSPSSHSGVRIIFTLFCALFSSMWLARSM